MLTSVSRTGGSSRHHTGRTEIRGACRSTDGLAVMLGSATSNQVGATVGAHAFATVGPAGVVAVRQFVAAVALLAGPL